MGGRKTRKERKRLMDLIREQGLLEDDILLDSKLSTEQREVKAYGMSKAALR